MLITNAEPSDLQKILDLQYLAFQSEAIIHNNFNIQPLLQTLAELRIEYENGIILKAIDSNDTIIGSVRGYTENNTLYICKLMVHPEHQCKGIGSQLLYAIEQYFPKYRYEIFTSEKSIKNLHLYESKGYQRYMEKMITPELKLIYLEKNG